VRERVRFNNMEEEEEEEEEEEALQTLETFSSFANEVMGDNCSRRWPRITYILEAIVVCPRSRIKACS
jgi:hypothetical protein